MDIEKFKRSSFSGLEKHLKPLRTAAFAKASQQKKNDEVSKTLFNLIDEAKEGEFLLPPVLDFLSMIAEEKILEHYTFSTFEVWLNQFSGISFEENYRIRGKIMGKWVPREEYQLLFPLGMGKVYPGSHFVTAHRVPRSRHHDRFFLGMDRCFCGARQSWFAYLECPRRPASIAGGSRYAFSSAAGPFSV